MNKNTLLYLILIVLIVMNGFFLFKYLGNPEINRPVGQRGSPSEFIAKELNFNDAQLEELMELDSKQREKMVSSNDEIIVLKDVLFGHISNPSVKPSTIDSLTTLIGVREKEKDMNVFNHFKAIQNICNDKQKRRFDKIVKDALHPNNGPMGKRGEGPPPPRN